ncbi:pectate lyase [Sulfuriroseicoccus oceanibius]|uniref:Pectate lyase n=1 Tax=Sulfuriroseicoccus oceanibius TaxID=2707525 RepID=A0A6B3LB64_9BACT|nr:pectate lyase [Sulfuriroseicoccus oceanibius]QQL45808.1 pectate lyase [Sulfuriroseicoccus oceanibius]
MPPSPKQFSKLTARRTALAVVAGAAAVYALAHISSTGGGFSNHTGDAPPPAALHVPEATRDVVVTDTIFINRGRHVDFQGIRLIPMDLGDGSQREDQRPVIELASGASVSNVIIAAPGADGIHCYGDNTLENVVFEDVGEDAVTVKGPRVTWQHGGARNAEDKVVQMNHQGPFIGRNLVLEDFGRGVRGNGMRRYQRTPFEIELHNVRATNGTSLVKLTSKGSRAKLRNVVTWGVTHVARVSNGASVDHEATIKY